MTFSILQKYMDAIHTLLREMAEDLIEHPDQQFKRQQAIDWFKEKYPDVSATTVGAQLARLSTNVRYRIHYSPKPGEDDVFFKIDSQHYRLYNPDQDPKPIHALEEPPNDELGTEEDTNPQGSSEFAYESDLQKYLAKNLSVIKPGLTPYESEGISGIEFPAGDGRSIDILAIDSNDDFVVIELKVSRGYDRVVGQLLRYMAWVRQNEATSNQKVYGIIIAREISNDLLLASSEARDIQLFEYELSFNLKQVETGLDPF